MRICSCGFIRGNAVDFAQWKICSNSVKSSYMVEFTFCGCHMRTRPCPHAGANTGVKPANRAAFGHGTWAWSRPHMAATGCEPGLVVVFLGLFLEISQEYLENNPIQRSGGALRCISKIPLIFRRIPRCSETPNVHLSSEDLRRRKK